MARDTLVYLFQQLGFVINLKKSILKPVQKIEFLGLETLPVEKVTKLKLKCKKLMQNPITTLGEVASLIGTLCSAAQAVLPAFLQMRYLEQQHIVYSRVELMGENLEISNGRANLTSEIKVIIQTDASKKGWDAFCQNKSVGG